MKKSELRNIIRESSKELISEQHSNTVGPTGAQIQQGYTPPGAPNPQLLSCDNSMNGSCAQTHLPPNINWPNMVNFGCTGNKTFMALYQRMMATLPVDTTSPEGIVLKQTLQLGEVVTVLPDYSTVSSAVDTYATSTGISNQQKNKIKRKLSKIFWLACMIQHCMC